MKLVNKQENEIVKPDKIKRPISGNTEENECISLVYEPRTYEEADQKYELIFCDFDMVSYNSYCVDLL